MTAARLLGAGLAAVTACAAPVSALAADLPVYPEPPVYVKPAGGWYLRGYIGMTNQRVDELYNVLFDTTADLAIVDKNFEAGPLGGGGIGYAVNNWLRLDATAEYRGEAGFHGLDTFTDAGGNARFNNYTAKKSEWLFLANVYADLGNFHGIVPYVGAGLGASRNSIHSFRDEGFDPATNRPTLAFAESNAEWDLAWALHAGLGYQVTDQLTLDFGYSYVHLGDGASGDLVTFDNTNNIVNPMEFEDITSHDFKLGVRYAFN